MSQTVGHRSKQMVVGKSNVLRVCRVGSDLLFQRFQVCLNRSCDMWPRIVMLDDNFVMSLLVRFHSPFNTWLKHINFIRYRSPVMVHLVSIAYNTPHRAGPTKCRVQPRYREYSVWRSTQRHVRAFPIIFCARDYCSGPIFRRRSQCNVKTPSDSVFEAAVYKQRNAVQRLSALHRTEPNFLASESLSWL